MREKQLNLFGTEDTKPVLKKRHNITLPLDTLIMFVIVIVLLLSLSFSLGVERGRKLTYLNEREYGGDRALEEIMDTSIVTAKTPNKKVESVSNKEEKKDTENSKEIIKDNIQIPINKEADSTKTIKENKTSEKSNPPKDNKNVEKYIIQVASYLKEGMANNEVKKLENSGYPAFVSKKGKFIVIFVGEFNDKQKAEEKMRSLKKKYNDCILRRL